MIFCANELERLEKTEPSQQQVISNENNEE
jgi:hypothetical protein